MGRACITNGEMRNVYKIMVGKPVGKRPLRRYRRKLEDNTVPIVPTVPTVPAVPTVPTIPRSL
jgi:hypothetical protein